ncbi:MULTISPECIES: hypothetical protein [Arthrobacter]
MRELSSPPHVAGTVMRKDWGMQIPRFILITFLAVLVGGTTLATTLLVSSSEPELGESIVVTPAWTPPTGKITSEPSASNPPASTSPSSTPTEGNLPPELPAAPLPIIVPPPNPVPARPLPPSNGAIEVPVCAPLAGDEDCDDDWEDYWDDYWDDYYDD